MSIIQVSSNNNLWYNSSHLDLLFLVTTDLIFWAVKHLALKSATSKDKSPCHWQGDIIYVFQCKGNACGETCMGEVWQSVHKHMYQHGRPRYQESSALPFVPTSMLQNTLLRTKALLRRTGNWMVWGRHWGGHLRARGGHLAGWGRGSWSWFAKGMRRCNWKGPLETLVIWQFNSAVNHQAGVDYQSWSASHMGCRVVATKTSGSRWPELYQNLILGLSTQEIVCFLQFSLLSISLKF